MCLSRASILSAIAVLFAATVAVAQAAPYQSVFVRSGENGQGFLFSRLDSCYALTPAHVMGQEAFASIVGSGKPPALGDGQLLQAFPADLSLLRVTGELASKCGAEFSDVQGLDRTVMNQAQATINSVNEDGSVTRRRAVVADVDLVYLRIKPLESGDELFKGLSGSLVTVSDKAVGMLQQVDPKTGEGKVLRLDRALESVHPFFGGNATKPKPLQGKVERSLPGNEKDLASASRGGRLLSWSAEPVAGKYRAANLIDDDAATLWYASANRFPIDIVIELGGGQVAVIEQLELVGEGLDQLRKLPKDFEILVSNTGQGGWMSVASGTFFTTEKIKDIKFSPVRARKVMLRFYSNWGDSTAIGLSGIRVYTR